MLTTFNYVLFALLIIANASIVYLFIKRGASSRWIVKLLAAWVVGALIGYYGSQMEYRMAPGTIIVGFPLMRVISLDGYQGRPPSALIYVDVLVENSPIVVVANMIAMAMLFACPVGVWFYLLTQGHWKRS